MGSVMRRTSSILTISRPGTPSANERDPDASARRASDASSLKDSVSPPPLPTLAPPASSSHQSMTPSPIAESPAREAAANQELPPVGPSPLAQGSAENETPDAQNRSPASSDYGYVPPPVIDSSVAGLGPGAFTDDPDDLPQPTTIRDPSMHTPSIRHASSFRQAPDSVDGHGGSTSHSHAGADGNADDRSLAPPQSELSVRHGTGSYFDLPVANSPEPEATSQYSGAFKEYIHNDDSETAFPTETTARPADSQSIRVRDVAGYNVEESVQVSPPPQMPVPPNEELMGIPVHEEPTAIREAPAPVHEESVPAYERPAHVPVTAIEPLPMPSYDLRSDHVIWGGVSPKPSPKPSNVDKGLPDHGDVNGRSRASSVRCVLTVRLCMVILINSVACLFMIPSRTPLLQGSWSPMRMSHICLSVLTIANSILFR